MTINDWARLLFILGALFAVVGPALAVARAVLHYRREKDAAGTWDWVDARHDQENIRSRMRRDAWSRATELVLIGVGVALSAIASLVLIA